MREKIKQYLIKLSIISIINIFLLFGFLLVYSRAADLRWEKNADKPIKSIPTVKHDNPKSLYDTEKENKIMDVLKESPTPLRTPDTIIRVLFLPYTDSKGILHNYYYTFMKVEEGSWVLGDYLLAPVHSNKRMVLKPIDYPLTGAQAEKEKDKKKEKEKEKKKREDDKDDVYHFKSK